MLDGKIKKKDNPKRYHAFNKAIQQRINEGIENLVWLAEKRPDLLQDLETELLDEKLPMKRRARALLKAVSLFENEPNVFSLIAEIYSDHVIGLEKKKYTDRTN